MTPVRNFTRYVLVILSVQFAISCVSTNLPMGHFTATPPVDVEPGQSSLIVSIIGESNQVTQYGQLSSINRFPLGPFFDFGFQFNFDAHYLGYYGADIRFKPHIGNLHLYLSTGIGSTRELSIRVKNGYIFDTEHTRRKCLNNSIFLRYDSMFLGIELNRISFLKTPLLPYKNSNVGLISIGKIFGVKTKIIPSIYVSITDEQGRMSQGVGLKISAIYQERFKK